MRCLKLAVGCAVLSGLAVFLSTATEVRSQQPQCAPATAQVRSDIGSPDANGYTLQDRLNDPAERHAYAFHVPQPAAAFIYVGDQWYDLDLVLYTKGICVAAWEVSAKAYSFNSERRVIQYVRPDEEIINVNPDDYELVVSHKYWQSPQAATDFDPSRNFTVRVALAPKVCSLAPPNNQPNPKYPGLFKRPDDALYQLGLSFQPDSPGPFDLMSFNAVVSPPYLDLFDFDWTIDGQPVPGVTSATVQQAVSGLPATADGQHRVRVTARGVREYSDPGTPPEYRLPPTLSTECSFTTRAS
jgi:hypothetical protein